MKEGGQRRSGPAAIEPSTDEALLRARQLVDAAADALRERDDEIRQLQAVLERVLASAISPLVVVEDGVVRAWSARMEQATGIPARSAVGRRLASLVPDLAQARPRVDLGGTSWSVRTEVDGEWQVIALDARDRIERLV